MNAFARLSCLLCGVLLAPATKAADLSLPILQSADLAVVDSGTESGPHFKYRLFVRDDSGVDGEYYGVSFTLVTTSSSSGYPLRTVRSGVVFLPGEIISSTNKDYRDAGGGNWLPVQAFDETREIQGADWRYIDTTTGRSQLLANGRTEFFIGFRFAGDEGQHYGWMRFNRTDTNFLTFFQLTAWDWNPLPGEPIGAGLPPAIPLNPQVTGEGMLHLAWPVAAAGWILETSDTLGPGAVWEPVADVAGNEALLSPPDGTRFFRLRRP